MRGAKAPGRWPWNRPPGWVKTGIGALLAGLALLPGTGGTDCVDYGEFIHRVGGVDTPGHAYGVAMAGSFAYVADGPNRGLKVVNISNPAAPAIVGSVVTPGDARGVAVAGSFAYVADGDFWGLRVVNISNPAAPVIVGGVNTPGNAHAVAVAGSFAYVADGNAGLHVVNVSNPAAPVIVGSMDTPGSAYGVAVADSFAYVADADRGLQIVDISNPAAPAIVGSIGSAYLAFDVAVAGSYAYLADNRRFQIVDVSNPAAPAVVGSLDHGAIGVVVAGSVAYLAVGGLQVVDISNPAAPAVIGSASTPSAQDVAAAGSLACIGDFDRGLEVVDVSNPASPPVVGRVDLTQQRAYGVAVAGDFAYVAGPSGDLLVVDETDPASPAVVGTAPFSDARSVAVAGPFAYVVGSYSGLHVVDVSNPAAPAILGTASLPPTPPALGVAVAGTVAYVVSSFSFPPPGESNFYVVDVSNPSSPTIRASMRTWSYAQGVALRLETAPASRAPAYAYIADTYQLLVVDVSVPESPAVVGAAPAGDARAVAVAGDFAYVAGGVGGLGIVDVSNPALPVVVGTVNTSDVAAGVAVDGSFAYVADRDSGLQVIDVLNPAAPAIAGGYHDAFSPAQAVAVGSGFAHVVMSDLDAVAPSAFLLLPTQCSQPAGVEPASPVAARHWCLANRPNPFRGGGEPAALEFELVRRTRARLVVFDVSGRIVRRLVDGTFGPGRQLALWDGRNARGEPVASGTYFFRFDAGKHSEARAMTLLR